MIGESFPGQGLGVDAAIAFIIKGTLRQLMDE